MHWLPWQRLKKATLKALRTVEFEQFSLEISSILASLMRFNEETLTAEAHQAE